MKSATVEVDEDLLESARRFTSEETATDVVRKALEELVRVAELKRGVQAMRDTNEVFWPHYLEEIRPNSWAAYEKRRAAYEGREPEEVTPGSRPR